MIKKILIPILILCSISFTFADSSQNLWKDIKLNKEPVIKSAHYRSLTLDFDNLKVYLNQAPWENLNAPFSSSFEIDIPLPKGGFETFLIQRTKLMEDELAAKFLGIRTFNGISKTDRLRKIVIDYTYQGFHAVIRYNNNSIFIDPFTINNQTEYTCYFKSDFVKVNTHKMTKNDPIDPNNHRANSINLTNNNNNNTNNPLLTTSGTDLRTYRLAVAATGEYTSFHGGTVALGLSAITTTVVRINQVYENDLSIRLILVSNNNLLVYTNSGTDPYTNFNAGADLGINQSNCNTVIGSANYDIGHIVGTGGGGLASLGVPCTGSKARGVTGSLSPVNDPFDIDYVAHEMGHQFGAEHTFNAITGSCGSGNRSGSTAYEPGSGSTIMAYAGICGGGDNLQNNSDDHFHNSSYNQIITYSTLGSGNNCPVITSTGNTPPTVDAGTGGLTIPISTPFELKGVATDLNGDVLTYNWEEWDLGPAGAVNSPTGNAPLFRSFPSSTSPIRVFPMISSIVNNTSTKGEMLPTYTRQLKFKLTVRDNAIGSGGVTDDQVNYNVSVNAGPFLVNSPNTSVIWAAQSYQVVEWDVANTDAFPVSCPNVDIMLSTDGGFTYPDTLISNIPNNGSTVVLLPNITTNQARIKVKGSNHIFFDISNQNFSIVPALSSDFNILHLQDTISECGPNDVDFDFYFSQLLGFNENIALSVSNLPTGATSSFSNNNFVPSATTTLTISNTGNIASGTYNIYINAVSNTVTHIDTVTLTINNGTPASPLAVTPNGNSNGSTTPIFIWKSAIGATSYRIEIASDQLFSSILWSESNIKDTFFISRNTNIFNTPSTYYWRVKAFTPCAESIFSAASGFTTKTSICFNEVPTDIPVQIPFIGEITSVINIARVGTVSDINIFNLKGNHTSLSELRFTLISPSGKEVIFIDQICGSDNNFDISLDDQSQNIIPCPATGGGSYHTKKPLSGMIGENIFGDWTLKVEDLKAGIKGVLNSYSLEICTNDETTTIEAEKNISFNMYPNPANEKLTISLINTTERMNGDIYSTTGQLVKHFKLASRISTIDISDLAKGVYQVTIWNNQFNKIEKLIIK